MRGPIAKGGRSHQRSGTSTAIGLAMSGRPPSSSQPPQHQHQQHHAVGASSRPGLFTPGTPLHPHTPPPPATATGSGRAPPSGPPLAHLAPPSSSRRGAAPPVASPLQQHHQHHHPPSPSTAPSTPMLPSSSSSRLPPATTPAAAATPPPPQQQQQPHPHHHTGSGAAAVPAAAPSGGEEEEDNRLELEHVIGLTGCFPQTCWAHPKQPNKTIASVAAMVVIADLEDPHDQMLLRAHDMQVSALAVCHSGDLIASGQVGTVHRKGFGAPVVVWDYHNKTELYLLHGITQRVNRLSFSPDDRLLLGCGEDGQLLIWDMHTGEVVYSRRFPPSSSPSSSSSSSPLALCQWASVFLKGRRPAYELVYSATKEVEVCEFSFDATRVQWALTASPVAMPCTGLVRRYLCSGVSSDGDYLLAGTAVGEMVVLRITAKVYRASIPVGSGGIWCMLVAPPAPAPAPAGGGLGMADVVFCGCGDGTIRKIRGADMRWELVGHVRLPCASKVTSISHIAGAGGAELLVGTAAGCSYRVLSEDLSCRLVSSAHTSPLRALAFPKHRPDIVATGSIDGRLNVWDLSSYAVIATNARENTTAGGITAMVWCDGDGVVVCGWGDGFLRAYGAITGAKVWQVPNAHRKPVSALASHSDASSSYLVSGGEDGSVRVWHGASREMMMQFTEHTQAVSALVVDVSGGGRRLHSASRDCMVLSYDLKAERRYNLHTVRDGGFTGLSQRHDAEKELVTCDTHGRLLFWDCDYPEPTLAVYDDSPHVGGGGGTSSLTCVQVSPATGRYLLTAGTDSSVKALDLQALANNHTPRKPGGAAAPIGLGRGHSSTVVAVAWSPDERQAVSIGEDATICIWNFYQDQH